MVLAAVRQRALDSGSGRHAGRVARGDGYAEAGARVSAAKDAEEAFAIAVASVNLMDRGMSREYRFHPDRRWRFDFAWPDLALAVEIEGRGRHQTVVGFRHDCEKYNEAIAGGWRVMRFPATDFKPSTSRALWPRGALDWAWEVYAVVCAAR